MKPTVWWKNFALGMEVDAAGTFVYNGIRSLHELQTLNHPVDSMEVVYNLSVGIERLLKVAIILLEHTEESDIEALEESLISHSTIDLAVRVNEKKKLALTDMHREFLSLLSKYYKSHRYGRYSLSAIPNIQEEKFQFLGFICKHLKLEMNFYDEFVLIENTDQIRRFVGKIVKKICSEIFDVIKKRALELNIYTTEIRGNSKALKVFYGRRLDFLDDEIRKKEILHYLMSDCATGDHVDLIRSIEPLDFDPDMIPSYIKGLLNQLELPHVAEEVDYHYSELSNVKERLEVISVMDNDFLSYRDCDEA